MRNDHIPANLTICLATRAIAWENFLPSKREMGGVGGAYAAPTPPEFLVLRDFIVIKGLCAIALALP
jgi:hypothetical protein